MLWKQKRNEHAVDSRPDDTDKTSSQGADDGKKSRSGSETVPVADRFVGTEARTIIDSIAEGVVVFTDALRVRFANRGARRLLGDIDGEELEEFVQEMASIGRNPKSLAHSEYPPRRALREGLPIKTIVLWTRPDGVSHEVEIFATPLRRDRETVGVVMTIRNVEQQLQVERELREFIAIASHQFRTPLASISWFLEILLSGRVGGKLGSQQTEMVQQAQEAVKRLKDTIHLTLNAASTEFGVLEVKPEPHDIGKLLKEEVDHMTLFAKRKQQEIKLYLPRTSPTIPVDVTIFRFVMMNLLSNAVKYSPEGGEIVVETTTEPRRLLISVKDNGVGIPQKDQSRIFTKFFRAGNIMMKSEGTGLGLYIVKNLLESVGGSIWFESTEGKGTTFTVVIPQSGFKRIEGRAKLEPTDESMYGIS